MKNATPNQLDCPSSLRVDHEEQILDGAIRIREKTTKLRLSELIEVEKIIDSCLKNRANKDGD